MYRLFVTGTLQVEMSPEMEPFEPCKRFLGPIPEYVFRTGDFGTGYYRDEKSAMEASPGKKARQSRRAAQMAKVKVVEWN